MEVERLLLKELMILDMKAQDKEQAIDEMINKLFDEKIISDKSDFKNRILEREKQLSTALGEGIAIPHTKSPAVLKNVVLFAVSRNGIDFDSLDGEKTFVFFMIAAKDGEHNTHLEILSSISKMLSDEEICKSQDPLPVEELLDVLGLLEHKDKIPSQLSGGQQQRIAIGRAIAKKPGVLLCDEPTGALDYSTSKEILKLIEEINRKYKTTVVLVTHNEALKDMADVVLYMKDGRITAQDKNETKTPVEELEW